VRDFPSLNVLINNAGILQKINLHKSASNLGGLEIEINLNGPIMMAVQFLPQLKMLKRAAIVNVSPVLLSCRWRFRRSIVPQRQRSTRLHSRFGFS
jgi:short-subunit dehydrogenase involved in D-alanine esterification of teichoic acids